MGVAIGSYSCMVFYAAFLQMIAGTSTQEQSSPVATNRTMESSLGQARSPHKKIFTTSTLNPCEIAPHSPSCYQYQCGADDIQCIIFLLLTAPDNVGVIDGKDLSSKPLGFYSVVESIILGLRLAVEECKHQFYWNYWNCPVSTGAVVTGNIHSTGTRQVAYLQAISAAAVMHFVTKTCTHRENDLCRCGRTSNKVRRNYGLGRDMVIWGGCADNVKFGERVSEQFFGTNIRANEMSKMTTLSKLHNERVGRMAVRKSVRLDCRCHGPTGSCSIRTCWTVLADFRVVSDLLRKKYEESSKRVTDLEELVNNNGVNVDNSTNSTIPTEKVITKHDLAYFADPPDYYCVVNYTAGYFGASGRECYGDESPMIGSCDILCGRCGKEVKKFVYHEMYDCDCIELWCCSPRCKHCMRKVTKYFCA